MARIKFTNIKAVEDSIKAQIYKKLAKVAPQIQIKATEILKSTYQGEFSKDPVDTGQAKKDSRVDLAIRGRNSQGQNVPSMTIGFEIKGEAEKYALYFMYPISPSNPNFKYGKRDTVVRARDNLAKFLGIKK